jgi:hypothetical protein
MEKRKMRLSYDKVADVLFDQTFHFFKKWNVYIPIDFEKRFSQKIEETLPITIEELNP